MTAGAKPRPQDGRDVTEALALAIAANLPVLVWGAPGTGKTSLVRSIAAEMGLPIEVVVGSVREPSDFAGLPVVYGSDTHFAPPQWARRLAEAGQGVLFLDELTTAPPSVQAAMLRVVLERNVGDLALPDEVRVVAAANPPQLAADGWDLSAPLANRLLHLDWEAQPRAVVEGFEHGFADVGALQAHPPDRSEVRTAMISVAAFLRVRPELVLDLPRTPEAAGRAWPSPRTWEMAARALAACRANDASDPARRALVAGCVGDAAAWEALAWLEAGDLPDPRALLDGEDLSMPERADRLHAVLHGVVAVAVEAGDPKSWWAAWRVLSRAAAAAPDVAASAARALAQRRPVGAGLPPDLEAFLPILKEAELL